MRCRWQWPWPCATALGCQTSLCHGGLRRWAWPVRCGWRWPKRRMGNNKKVLNVRWSKWFEKGGSYQFFFNKVSWVVTVKDLKFAKTDWCNVVTGLKFFSLGKFLVQEGNAFGGTCYTSKSSKHRVLQTNVCFSIKARPCNPERRIWESLENECDFVKCCFGDTRFTEFF